MSFRGWSGAVWSSLVLTAVAGCSSVEREPRSADLSARDGSVTGSGGGETGGAGGTGPLGAGGSSGGGASADAGPGPYAYCYANGGHVYGVPKGAGGTVLLAAGTPTETIGGAFTFDAGHVYYSSWDASTLDGPMRIVMQPTTDGGRPVTLVSGLHWVNAITVDATALYFVDVTPAPAAPATIVGKVPLTGAEPADSGTFEKLAESAEGTIQGGRTIATYGDYVYWGEAHIGMVVYKPVSITAIKRTPKVGGAIDTLASNIDFLTDIAVDASGLYFLAPGQGTYTTSTYGSVGYLAPGAQSPVVLASNLAGASSLAVKDGTAYFATMGWGPTNQPQPIGTVSKVSPSGSVETLAQGLTDPDNLYVDGADVYFTVVTDPQTGTWAPSIIPR
jgi:hypothetical protein